VTAQETTRGWMKQEENRIRLWTAQLMMYGFKKKAALCENI
jgi:hypothetical protein